MVLNVAYYVEKNTTFLSSHIFIGKSTPPPNLNSCFFSELHNRPFMSKKLVSYLYGFMFSGVLSVEYVVLDSNSLGDVE